MKKIVLFGLCMALLLLPGSVFAFDIVTIRPDTGFVDSLGRDVEVDKAYLRDTAHAYSGRFVVSEKSYADVTGIDGFYAALSSPITQNEIDTGALSLSLSFICDTAYRRQMNTFKVLGGMAGYSASFEPVIYYAIYRDIELVGGYVHYSRTFADSDVAYWQCINGIEELTKEIIPPETRMSLSERLKELEAFMNADIGFKVFLLKGGQIDSLYEKGDA